MGKIVRRTWDEVEGTPICRARLAQLAQRPDSEIDYSDIPEAGEDSWKNAVRNPFYKPVKKQVTLRIDADVLAWLRGREAEGYQSRLNAVLRRAMVEELQGRKKKRA